MPKDPLCRPRSTVAGQRLAQARPTRHVPGPWTRRPRGGVGLEKDQQVTSQPAHHQQDGGQGDPLPTSPGSTDDSNVESYQQTLTEEADIDHQPTMAVQSNVLFIPMRPAHSGRPTVGCVCREGVCRTCNKSGTLRSRGEGEGWLLVSRSLGPHVWSTAQQLTPRRAGTGSEKLDMEVFYFSLMRFHRTFSTRRRRNVTRSLPRGSARRGRGIPAPIRNSHL